MSFLGMHVLLTCVQKPNCMVATSILMKRPCISLRIRAFCYTTTCVDNMFLFFCFWNRVLTTRFYTHMYQLHMFITSISFDDKCQHRLISSCKHVLRINGYACGVEGRWFFFFFIKCICRRCAVAISMSMCVNEVWQGLPLAFSLLDRVVTNMCK